VIDSQSFIAWIASGHVHKLSWLQCCNGGCWLRRSCSRPPSRGQTPDDTMSRKRETQAQQTCRLLDAGSYVLPDTGRRVALAEPTRKGTVHEDASKLVLPAAATVAPAVQVRVIKASAFSAAAQLVIQQHRQQQQGAAAAVGAPARRKRRNGAQGSRRDQRRKSGSSGSGGGVAVLDFASDSEPGGGWRGKQQGTQEEALCRASSLGRALEHLEYPLQQYGVAVVPEVVVFRTDDRACNLLPQPFVVGVVAAALRECGAEGGHKHRSHLRRKVQSVLAAAAHHGFTRLVLGAWCERGRPPHSITSSQESRRHCAAHECAAACR
jgi:hypothetical protein